MSEVRPQLDYAELKGDERLELERQAEEIRSWNESLAERDPETWRDSPAWLRS